MAHEHEPELRFETVEAPEGPMDVVHIEGDSLPTYEIVVDTSKIVSRTDITVLGPMNLEQDGTISHAEPSGAVELRVHGEVDEERAQAVAGDLALLLRKHLLPQRPLTAAPGETA